MVDEDSLDVVDIDDTAKKGPSLLVLLPVLLIGLGGGGFLGMSTLSDPVGEILADRALNKPEDSGGGHGGGGGHGEAEAAGSEMHMVDNLIVNPARSGGSRFLLTTIAVRLMDPDLTDYVEGHEVEIRSELLLLLGSKTTDELSEISNRTTIVAEVRRKIEEILGPNVVKDVFIPQFVIQ